MSKFIYQILFVLACSATLVNAQTMGVKSVTRAVVVGISDYQDEKIPNLKFAHRDALAFVDFLKSKGGGHIPEENIKLLINEQATTGQIYSVFDWLLDNSKENDKVFIYFSGHGDVETKTIRQRGYLLAYDTPANNYRSGAIRLEDLNDILATLAQVNHSQIILITDACRSGNLAGNSINGTQATAVALANQFANEIKIMSCQPNEFSLEGKQWGGGRGLFSYHLIEGLTGLADNINVDEQINLQEIERYLQDNVTKEATPANQFPTTFGNKSTRLFMVDKASLELLKEQKKNRIEGGMDMTASKSLESGLFNTLDSGIYEVYLDFVTALEKKYFLPSDQKDSLLPGQSASELYEILSKEERLESIHNLLKRNFAAALQDKSQQAIIAYLNTDPDELKKRYIAYGEDYRSNPAYLDKAAELLGANHYLYHQILAKKFYFESILYRLKSERDGLSTLLDSAFQKIQLALQYDDQAAYIYNELGLIKQNLRDFQEARIYFDSAMVKAPTWALPLGNLLKNYRIQRQFEMADSIGRKALELKPDWYQIYTALGYNYDVHNKKAQAKEMYLKTLEICPDDVEANNNLAGILIGEQKYKMARPYLEKVLSLDSTYFIGYLYMGDYYAFTNNPDSAIIQYEKAISLKPDELAPYWNIAYQYMYTNQFENAKLPLEKLNVLSPGYVEYHFGLACWNSLQRKVPEGLKELETAIQKGLEYSRVRDDSDINALRETKKYQELIDQYFPDK